MFSTVFKERYGSQISPKAKYFSSERTTTIFSVKFWKTMPIPHDLEEKNFTFPRLRRPQVRATGSRDVIYRALVWFSIRQIYFKGPYWWAVPRYPTGRWWKILFWPPYKSANRWIAAPEATRSFSTVCEENGLPIWCRPPCTCRRSLPCSGRWWTAWWSPTSRCRCWKSTKICWTSKTIRYFFVVILYFFFFCVNVF